MHVVLVEDDTILAGSIAARLQANGHDVDILDTAANATKRGIQRNLDIMLLGLGLPDGDGLDVIQALRRRSVHVPILVFTDRTDPESRMSIFSCGGDDVLIKPFAFDELEARMKALVRRSGGPRWTPSNMLPIVMRDDLVVECDGKTAALSRREYALLSCLLRHYGDIVSRDEISKLAFDYELGNATNIVDVHLMHLRRKLAGFPIILESVRGHGIRAVGTDKRCSTASLYARRSG